MDIFNIIALILFFLFYNLVFIIWALVLARRYLKEHPSILLDEQDFIIKRMWHNNEIKRGAKAGILTEIIAVPIYLIILFSFILEIIYDEYDIENVELFSNITIFIYIIILSVILGFILGTLYTLLYTRLPSDSPTIKGMALGAIYTLYLAIINLPIFAYSSDISLKEQLIIYAYYILFYIFIFGILIGIFWSYLKRKEEPIEKN